jgi:hypothetical protein
MNPHQSTYNLKEQRQGNILHADGYVDVSGIQPLFTYHLKDHLGNVRIVLQAGGSSGNLKQTNDYYPFGMAFTKNAADSEEESFARENKYKYNGKLKKSRFFGRRTTHAGEVVGLRCTVL